MNKSSNVSRVVVVHISTGRSQWCDVLISSTCRGKFAWMVRTSPREPRSKRAHYDTSAISSAPDAAAHAVCSVEVSSLKSRSCRRVVCSTFVA